jgi:hypothetical protein
MNQGASGHPGDVRMIEQILTSLNQGNIASIVIAAGIVMLLVLLLGALARLGAALVRVGCLVVAIATFLYAVTRSFGS